MPALGSITFNYDSNITQIILVAPNGGYDYIIPSSGSSYETVTPDTYNINLTFASGYTLDTFNLVGAGPLTKISDTQFTLTQSNYGDLSILNFSSKPITVTDIKPVYKKVAGEWVKQTAYERISGAWVKISDSTPTPSGYNVTIDNGVANHGDGYISYKINDENWVELNNLSSTVNLTNVQTIQFLISPLNAPSITTYRISSTILNINIMDNDIYYSPIYTLSQNVDDIVVDFF